MRARDADVRVISPEELGLDSGMVGLSGSPTRVVRIFKPSFARNTALRVHDESGAAVDSFIDLVTGSGDHMMLQPQYAGVMVVGEQREGTVHPVCL
jgi:hypothetical protein